MKLDKAHADRQRLRYTYRDGTFTFSGAALSELQRQMSMTKDEREAEDEVLNTWRRYETRYARTT